MLSPNDLADGSCPPSLANAFPDQLPPSSDGSSPGVLAPL